MPIGSAGERDLLTVRWVDCRGLPNNHNRGVCGASYRRPLSRGRDHDPHRAKESAFGRNSAVMDAIARRHHGLDIRARRVRLQLAETV
jgi:hypothetical protein